jgi:hypothetical protein
MIQMITEVCVAGILLDKAIPQVVLDYAHTCICSCSGSLCEAYGARWGVAWVG